MYSSSRAFTICSGVPPDAGTRHKASAVEKTMTSLSPQLAPQIRVARSGKRAIPVYETAPPVAGTSDAGAGRERHRVSYRPGLPGGFASGTMWKYRLFSLQMYSISSLSA